MKKYIRYLYESNQGNRERLRIDLNNLGFYCLNAPDGLFVYAIESLPQTFLRWLLNF